MSSFYNTNQTGQIPYLDPRRRSTLRFQWSLKWLVLLLLVTGPICWWLAWIDWLHVPWMEFAQVSMIVGSSVLPCMLIVGILLRLEWYPLVSTAAVLGLSAVLLGIYACVEVSAALAQEEFNCTYGMRGVVSPVDQAITFSILFASVSALIGVVLGFLIGVARERGF